jgi:hypothetical protein
MKATAKAASAARKNFVSITPSSLMGE